MSALAEREPQRVGSALDRTVHTAPRRNAAADGGSRQAHGVNRFERTERRFDERDVAAHERPRRTRRADQGLARHRESGRVLDAYESVVAEALRVELVSACYLARSGDRQRVLGALFERALARA